MIKKRIFTIALAVVMVFSALAVMPAASAVSSPVSLIYAKPEVVSHNAYGASNVAATGYIEVENLAYAKNVVVHYTTNGTTWEDVQAEYFQSTQGNYEAWKFTTGTVEQYYRGTVSIQFAIKYEVNGQVYWDNNNGSNYIVKYGYDFNPQYDFGSGGVALGTAYTYSTSGTDKMQGYVELKNLGYNKEVFIRYSTDNWATYEDVNAAYHSTYSNTYVEQWTFTEELPADWETVELAVCYKVNGIEYWDNNFGANYVITNS